MRDAVAALPIPGRLLGALLLLLAGLMAPHAANLDPAILGFFYITALWRFTAIQHAHWMPRRWLLLIMMLGALALVVITTGLADGRVAGTALLVVMLGMKLLEVRARRDIHITVFLGYFLVMTQFLYDQSLWLAAYLFLGVVALTVIQVGLNRVHVDLRLQVRHTGSMLAAALPLATVMFLLFPRLDTPLWAIHSAAATTGISGDMTLGDIGKLTQSNEVAFRVRFDDAAPPPEQRYWRGPVLWQTDGRHWSAGMRPVPTARSAAHAPAPLRYEVTLEPTGEYWLFGLDLVVDAPDGAHLNRNAALIAQQRIHKRHSYRAGSDPARRPDGLSAAERRMALQLPSRVSARVRALAQRWQDAGSGDPRAVSNQALRHFREQPFVYTLAPGTLGADPVDEFLFDTRRGFCEHYATSYVTLMRIAGVPARVVLGYQGAERNPHAEHWVVRQSDAHAWAEIWVPGEGWVRVDPTAAVAPERIEQSIDTARSQAGDRVVFATAADGLLGGLWRNAAWIADAVDLGWYRWVVGFSALRQQNLLSQFGLSDLKGVALAIALVIASAMAVAVVYLVARLPKPVRRDPLQTLWQRFVDKLQRAGLRPRPWQGADTVCGEAIQRFPAAADQLVAISRLYVQLRYGRRRDARQMSALRQRIRVLRLRSS
ncbi:MAG: DUF3488 and transglutaminase-like domain-containing protein [Gammaproteobacteria bacterium]|nr:DUF3488 and transglutaminase-like domain-containing protein [Gammaproteobacteria bacterium]